jgi:hypothetical protein
MTRTTENAPHDHQNGPTPGCTVGSCAGGHPDLEEGFHHHSPEVTIPLDDLRDGDSGDAADPDPATVSVARFQPAPGDRNTYTTHVELVAPSNSGSQDVTVLSSEEAVSLASALTDAAGVAAQIKHGCGVSWCDERHEIDWVHHSRDVGTVVATAHAGAFASLDSGLVVPTVSAMLVADEDSEDRTGPAVMLSLLEPSTSDGLEPGRWSEVYLTPGEVRQVRDRLTAALGLLEGGQRQVVVP